MAERQRGELFAPAEKNVSALITSPPARSWIKVAKALSRSRSVLACRTWSCSPRVWAAACMALDRVSATGIGRVDEHGHRGRRGDQFVQHLEPFGSQLHAQGGHAREVAARPAEAGDKSQRDGVGYFPNTIGIVVVAAFAANAEGRPPATITATRRRTRSAANAGNRSYWPSAQR